MIRFEGFSASLNPERRSAMAAQSRPELSKVIQQTEFRLKVLRSGTIPAALERAEWYRLLNEPTQAESICLDILAADAGNQVALILLLLSLTDQFENPHAEERASALLPQLSDDYQRAYY